MYLNLIYTVNRFLIKSPTFNPWTCCLLAYTFEQDTYILPVSGNGLVAAWTSHSLKRALFHYVYIMDPSDVVLAKG